MISSHSKVLSKRLVLAGLCLLAVIPSACSTSGFGDEDAVNQRSRYRDDDQANLLPSPAQAAEEARLYQTGEEVKKVAQSRRNDETFEGESEAPTNDISDLNAAYAQILVPQGQEEQAYFAPAKNRQGQGAAEGESGTKRRKPVFLSKVGVDALLTQAPSGVNVNAPALVTGGFSLAARASGRTSNAIRVQEGMGSYIVRPGDSLSTISMHIYGTSTRWMELAHLNRLGNGSIIFPKELLLYVPDKAMSPSP